VRELYALSRIAPDVLQAAKMPPSKTNLEIPFAMKII